jgi:hypothetical protein
VRVIRSLISTAVTTSSRNASMRRSPAIDGAVRATPSTLMVGCGCWVRIPFRPTQKRAHCDVPIDESRLRPPTFS